MDENNSFDREWKECGRIHQGPIGKALWSMCWPLLASSFFVSSIGLVDLLLAGRMGEAAQAAVGIGEQVLCLTIIVGTGLATGTAAFVARQVGAGNHAMARSYAQDSLRASLVAGVLAVFVGLTLSRLTFTIFQTDRLVAQVGTQYLELCAFGNLPFIVSCCLGAIFRSFAAPKYCLYLWLLTAGISIAGSFLLAAAPRQWCGNSVAALAIAWDIGCLVGTSAGLIWLRRLFRTLPLTGDSAKPVDLEALAGSGSIQRLLDIATVSVPAVVADSCWILANFLVFRILSVLPDATRAQAAWSIALKLEETFALMPLVALNLAAAVIVGQSLGAGNPLRARLATWQMAGTGALAMFILGGAIAVAAPALASLMSMDAGIGSWTIILLRGAPALLPLAAVWLIVLGGLEGAGDTRVSMLCNLLGLLCVQLPITWLFVIVFGWGATGICASLGAARLFLSGAALWGFCHVSPASGGVPQKISA